MRIVRIQMASLEWAAKIKIVRRLTQLLGKERYGKFRKFVRLIGM
jgi:hypothetical protein